MKNRQGFTMLELIITLSIITIVLSLVLPNKNIFSDYSKNNELSALERDLITARTRAVSEGKIYSFEMADNHKGYMITRDNKIIKKVNLNHIRFLKIFNFDFNFTGSVSRSGTIEISAGNNESYQIAIGVATGKITLKRD